MPRPHVYFEFLPLLSSEKSSSFRFLSVDIHLSNCAVSFGQTSNKLLKAERLTLHTYHVLAVEINDPLTWSWLNLGSVSQLLNRVPTINGKCLAGYEEVFTKI